MVQKRPFFEESFGISPKHPRLEQQEQLVLFLDNPFQDTREFRTSADAGDAFGKHATESDNQLEHCKITVEKKVDNTLHFSNSTSSWCSDDTSEEGENLKSPVDSVLPTEHYIPHRPRSFIQPRDTYSYLLRQSPLKIVPVGSEFQADIPEWCENVVGNAPKFSDSAELTRKSSETDEISSDEDVDKFVGHCVIPMPNLYPTSVTYGGLQSGRVVCCCLAPGCVSCVQQHVGAARENLKRAIGVERFSELGFDNMGEAVAQTWSEEEEQLFNDVVFSNPASSGENFWDHLASAFPYRTKKEIVSYYFNVFVIIRRAEQNRCDEMSIDSDNDDWQETDESEDDEDSCQNELYEHDSHVQDCGDENPGYVSPTCDYYDDKSFRGFNVSTNVPVEFTELERQGNEMQDICTSLGSATSQDGNQVKVEDSEQWGSQEFALEPCDAKFWDLEYLSCPGNEFDLLPTCNMIEELFGDEAWNSMGGGGML